MLSEHWTKLVAFIISSRAVKALRRMTKDDKSTIERVYLNARLNGFIHNSIRN